MPQNTLAGGGVGVRIDEAAGGGVIIAGLQIIQFRFAGMEVARGAKMASLSSPLAAHKMLPPRALGAGKRLLQEEKLSPEQSDGD